MRIKARSTVWAQASAARSMWLPLTLIARDWDGESGSSHRNSPPQPPGISMPASRSPAGAVLKDGARIHFCHGAASTSGHLVLLSREADPPYVQIVLDEAVHALAKDAFILRHAGGKKTLAGGTVLDPFPPLRGRRRPERTAVLAALDQPDARSALADALPIAHDGIGLDRFALAWNIRAGRDRGPLAKRRARSLRWPWIRRRTVAARPRRPGGAGDALPCHSSRSITARRSLSYCRLMLLQAGVGSSAQSSNI